MRKLKKEIIGIIIVLIIIIIPLSYFGLIAIDAQSLRDIIGITVGTLIASVLAYYLQRSIEEKAFKREKIYIPLYEELGEVINKVAIPEEANCTQIGIKSENIDSFGVLRSWIWQSVKDSYLNLMIPENLSKRIDEFYNQRLEEYNKQLNNLYTVLGTLIGNEFEKVGIKKNGSEHLPEETTEHIFGLGFVIALIRKNIDYYNPGWFPSGKNLRDAFKIFGKHFPQFKSYEEFFDYYSSEVEKLKEVKDFRDKQKEFLEEAQDIRKIIEGKVRHIWEID